MTAPNQSEPSSFHHLWRWLTGQLDTPAQPSSGTDRHEPRPPNAPVDKGRGK